MKINFQSNLGLYKNSNAGTAGAAKSVSAGNGRGKTDVIEFSRGGTKAPSKSVAAIKTALLCEAGAGTEPKRLEQLSASIKDGTYRVSTEELVDAILNP